MTARAKKELGNTRCAGRCLSFIGIALENGGVIHARDKVRIDGCTEIEQLTALRGDHPEYIGRVPIGRVLAQKP